MDDRTKSGHDEVTNTTLIAFVVMAAFIAAIHVIALLVYGVAHGGFGVNFQIRKSTKLRTFGNRCRRCG